MTTLTDAHPTLAALSNDLLASGKWRTWCAADPRLEGLPSLHATIGLWRQDRSTRPYLAVAALAAVGSSRGGDDNDAAMAVVLLLQDGITRLAADLHDRCHIDDVITAVWEEVKRSAPNLAHRAPRFLLQRAKARLLSPAHGPESPCDTILLDRPDRLETLSTSMRSLDATHGLEHQDDALADLTDLLDWARGTGALEQAEIDLILELTAAGHTCEGTEHAQRVVGSRHGLTMRTIRRRRDAVLRQLRAVAPAYLADVA